MQIGGDFPVEASDWHGWWREFRKSIGGESKSTKSGGDGEKLVCFATGDLVTPSLTHPKISGLSNVGGMGVGSPLVGFDKDAFLSYGLKQAENAAVSSESAAAYRAALDLLIQKSVLLVGAKIAHWFDCEVALEDDPLAWLIESDATQELSALDRAKRLMNSLRSGDKRVLDLKESRFYALTISGASGRVMIRDYMEGKFEALAEEVERWFSDLDMIDWNGTKPAPAPKMERIITCLLPPKQLATNYEDWIKPVMSIRASLWSAAVRGTPIPFAALAKVMVEHNKFVVTGKLEEAIKSTTIGTTLSLLHTRMALLKAYHLRNPKTKGTPESMELKPKLNEAHPAPAYHCGRLLSVLADLQRAALGDVGAGVVQRFYAGASVTPQLVIARLVRTSQAHIGQLDGGLANWYQRKIASIWGQIADSLPKTLTLEEQSLFALGYYHQMAQDFADKAERIELKKQNRETATND